MKPVSIEAKYFNRMIKTSMARYSSNSEYGRNKLIEPSN